MRASGRTGLVALCATTAFLGGAPCWADDDNGESIPLVVRAAGDSRCTAKSCADESVDYLLSGIYFGSRLECVFGLDPREPYTNVSGQPGAPAAWDDCDSPTDGCFWGYPDPDDGSCVDCTTDFHPVNDRVLWRHPSKEAIIASPILASCDPAVSSEGPSQLFDDNETGVSPRPAKNYCVFVGTTDSHFLALDEDPAQPPALRDGEDCIETVDGAVQFATDQPRFASCLWHFKTDHQVWRNAVAPSLEQCPDAPSEGNGHVLVPSKAGRLAKFDRYPSVTETSDCWVGQTTTTCHHATNPLSCPMSVLAWDPEPRIDESTLEIRGGLVAVRATDGSEMCVGDSRVIIAGTSEGVRSVKTDVPGPTVDYATDLKLDELLNETTPDHEKFERYGVQGIDDEGNPTNRIFFGFGASGNDASGLAAFDIDANGQLELAWRFKRGMTLTGEPPGCPHAQGFPPSTASVQLHRTSPAVSHDGAHVFATNRHASGADLSGALLAFAAETSSTDAELVACAVPSPGDGIVAAPAQATVPCAKAAASECCTGENPLITTKKFDRVIVLSKAQEVFVYDFCEGVFHPALTSGIDLGFAELRAQPVVAEEAGTYYFQDNDPTGERFFAFDLYEPDKLKWMYDTGLNGNPDVCKIGVPAGGRDCYPAPIPWVWEAVPASGGVTLTVCPHHATKPSIEELANANCEEHRIGGEVTEDAAGCEPEVDMVAVDRVFGVTWRNLDDPAESGVLPEDPTPESGRDPCFGGTIPASAFTAGSGSTNDFRLTARTNFGKEGSTEITLTLP